MAVVSASQQGAKAAVTHYKRLALGSMGTAKVSLLECRLETGRTHQIRVHLESLGFPLLGDPVYRKRTPGVAKSLPFTRQALHAYALSLQHPATHEVMTWFRLPPQDLIDLLPLVEMTEADLPREEVLMASIKNDQRTQSD
jgi:23S rRNA pseudouridine1911/1915/1917 synthase